MVTEKQYYEDTIANMKDLFAYQNTVSQRICDLEQRVAIDETSIAKNFELMEVQNSWQNKFFDEKFRYADLLEQCRINEATCKCIKGNKNLLKMAAQALNRTESTNSPCLFGNK